MSAQTRSCEVSDSVQRIASSIAAELRVNPKAWAKGPSGGPALCLCGLIGKHRLQGARSMTAAFTAAADVGYLHIWNDQPERTVAGVIELCERVAS